MYITGGVGSSHHGEAFTVPYDLPNDTAYAETCASIALAMFADRMKLIDLDGKYADLVERELYNGVLAGLSLDGKGFFYENPLEINLADHTRHTSVRDSDRLPITQRKEVFDCSCCPPNVTRWIASLGGSLYSMSGDKLCVHQFVPSRAVVDGMRLQMETDYPRNGRVRLSVDGAKGKTLYVRVPLWCRSAAFSAPYTMARGYAVLPIPDDTFVLDVEFRMEPVFYAANPAVRAAALASAKQALRLTAAYGAPVMLIVPGRVKGMTMPDPDKFKISFDRKTLLVDRVAEGDNAPYAAYIAAQNAATRYAYEAFEELVPIAAEEGVVLGIENVWNNLWVTPGFAAAFCRSFASPWVKFYFDIGNHTRYNAATEWLAALSDQIVKLHIKDFKIDRKTPRHGEFVPIGKGSIDFKAVRRAIDKVGYSGWVSIESSGWTDKEHSEIMDRFFDGKL